MMTQDKKRLYEIGLKEFKKAKQMTLQSRQHSLKYEIQKCFNEPMNRRVFKMLSDEMNEILIELEKLNEQEAQ